MAKTTKKTKKPKEISDEKLDAVCIDVDESTRVREIIVPISGFNSKKNYNIYDNEQEYCTNEFGYIKVAPTEQTLILHNNIDESVKETSMLVPIILLTMISIPLVIYLLYR